MFPVFRRTPCRFEMVDFPKELTCLMRFPGRFEAAIILTCKVFPAFSAGFLVGFS